jgi:hypothetical protein
VVPGLFSGYVLEAGELSDHGNLANFIATIQQKSKIDPTGLANHQTIRYVSLLGDELVMKYNPGGLRANGQINGHELNYAQWAGGNVYDSPLVKVGQGKMTIGDGTASYHVWFEGDKLRFGQD